jgi:hypothetical protein
MNDKLAISLTGLVAVAVTVAGVAMYEPEGKEIYIKEAGIEQRMISAPDAEQCACMLKNGGDTSSFDERCYTGNILLSLRSNGVIDGWFTKSGLQAGYDEKTVPCVVAIFVNKDYNSKLTENKEVYYLLEKLNVVQDKVVDVQKYGGSLPEDFVDKAPAEVVK